jgi:hypothetical protein
MHAAEAPRVYHSYSAREMRVGTHNGWTQIKMNARHRAHQPMAQSEANLLHKSKHPPKQLIVKGVLPCKTL